MTLQLCKGGQLCGCWILRSAQGRGEAPEVLGGERVYRCVHLPGMSFGKLGAPLPYPCDSMAELYMFVYKSFRGQRAMHTDDDREEWSQTFKAGEEKLTNRTGTERLSGIPQPESRI